MVFLPGIAMDNLSADRIKEDLRMTEQHRLGCCASGTREGRVTRRRRTLAWVIALGLALTGSLAEARRVALVIGNAAYADAPLRNPVNDAVDLSAKLRQLGFDVTTLTDRNRQQMTQAIRQFGLDSQGAEAALFYFAGHGVQVRGRNYLLPLGQRFVDEAEVEADAVEVGTVLARLDEAGARVSLVVLDACRTSPLRRSGRNVGRGLARMEAPSGALVAFAAQPGAEAQDGEGRNGTYTRHLLAHIGTPGLPVEQMFKRVRADVERETRRTQSPREESSLTADFAFVGSPVAVLGPSAEDRAWTQCLAATNTSPCEAYIAAYPAGRHVALATQQIRLIEQARPTSPPPGSASEKVTAATDVFFGQRAAELGLDSQAKLDSLVTKLRGVDLEVLIVVGHASAGEGSAEQALQLSRRRAEGVKSGLVALGVEANRVYTEGKGTAQPVADNNTADGRAKNRRVELEAVGTRRLR